jgi:hypothetical protein
MIARVADARLGEPPPSEVKVVLCAAAKRLAGAHRYEQGMYLDEVASRLHKDTAEGKKMWNRNAERRKACWAFPEAVISLPEVVRL